jgi:hypothetical protein
MQQNNPNTSAYAKASLHPCVILSLLLFLIVFVYLTIAVSQIKDTLDSYAGYLSKYSPEQREEMINNIFDTLTGNRKKNEL